MRSIRDIFLDEDGASAVLFGLALPPLMAMGAFALDLGSLYLAERRLQNIADAAAAAAVSAGADVAKEGIVAEVIAENGVRDVSILAVLDGEYRRDKTISWQERFDQTSLYPNATRVQLTQDVRLFFGSFVTAGASSQVTASATAARTDMAGFMLGTRVADLPGGLADNLLSALAGTALNLTPADVGVLSNTQIDVLDFAEALGPLQEMEGETFGAIFEAGTPLHQAVQAMADASDDPQLAAVLERVAALASSDFVQLSDLIDLGPLGNTDVNDGRSGVSVDAYSLLRSLLQAAHGDSYEATLKTDVTGLASVNVRLAGGYSEERSPWLTVDTMGDVTLRTAETRLSVVAGLLPVAGLGGGMRVPLYTELASAEAQMTDIVCDAGDGSDGVYIEAKPSIGTAAIADVNTDLFDDFSAPLWLEPARVVNTSLLKVNAYADISIGGDVAQEIHFTPEDVDDRQTKTVGTIDALEGTARSLAEDVDLDVRALGLGLNLGGVASLVGNALGTAAPSLDILVNQLTGLLGVKLGAADVTVDRLRCGRPTLVG
ncbi:pilus assembly protein TadG-related protein [Aurantiacibacter zhengii]|uniref:Putative Flp pilus-assembly TadG-like N-terminal domain-containing protein n=1 Tax=Aurantiacibacter zhengii TaxID=2307003 RepID=A0A418NX81_9SPHN|nr:pilus assembly protein TadG-related protein [Aurantiacibacter zhengii]RIV89220.1 hypothetical protein D2V07_02995 [Aurantiacibacter zhengii]